MPRTVQSQTLPLIIPTQPTTTASIPCVFSIKFKFLGGQLNYSGYQENIQRFLGVWGLSCFLWHRRIRVGFDLQFGQLRIIHHSASLDASLQLAEVSIRPFVGITIFRTRYLGIYVGLAVETPFSTKQSLDIDNLQTYLAGNQIELTAFTKPTDNNRPLINLFGSFNILEIMARLRWSILPERLETFVIIGYKRYAIKIENELANPIHTLLISTNHTADEFSKDVTLNAAAFSLGISVWIVRNRLYWLNQGMILPLQLGGDNTSYFYEGTSQIGLLWQ